MYRFQNGAGKGQGALRLWVPCPFPFMRFALGDEKMNLILLLIGGYVAYKLLRSTSAVTDSEVPEIAVDPGIDQFPNGGTVIYDPGLETGLTSDIGQIRYDPDALRRIYNEIEATQIENRDLFPIVPLPVPDYDLSTWKPYEFASYYNYIQPAFNNAYFAYRNKFGPLSEVDQYQMMLFSSSINNQELKLLPDGRYEASMSDYSKQRHTANEWLQQAKAIREITRVFMHQLGF